MPFILRIGIPIVRESVPELLGELEAFVLLYLFQPALGRASGNGTVESHIDLNRIEELGNVGKLLKTLRSRRRIDDTLPVLIGPARGPNADHALQA
jgi:hypothetical protein